MKHAGQVERSALATLQKWMPTYLRLTATEFGYPAGSLPNIRGWGRRSSVVIPDRRPEEQLPFLTVVIGGTTDVRLDGNDSYGAEWELQIGALVYAAKEDDARDLASLYSHSIRRVLVEQPWEGLDVNRWWLGDRYDVEDFNLTRTMASATCMFGVHLDGVLDAVDLPPNVPDLPSYPDAPTAEQINVTVTRE